MEGNTHMHDSRIGALCTSVFVNKCIFRCRLAVRSHFSLLQDYVEIKTVTRTLLYVDFLIPVIVSVMFC